MSGDYSRQRFDARRDYRGVLLQQGRVQLDADWNEQVELTDRHVRALTLDSMGKCVVPAANPNGLAVSMKNNELLIGVGRLYVDGILVENHGRGTNVFDPALAETHGRDALTLAQQPYGNVSFKLPDTGRFLVYVDVWHREVTHLEEPQLIEPALGFDTTTRLQAVWQVRVHPEPLGIAGCASLDNELPGWSAVIQPSGARLSTFIEEDPTEAGPCILPPTPGYRGLENRLYRVQIHSVGAEGATFKWSRDNAAIGARVLSIVDSQTIVVNELGRDELLRFKPGDWLELTTNVDEFAGRSGVMGKIESVDSSERRIRFSNSVIATLDETTDQWLEANCARVRRWDQHGAEADASGGVLKVPLDGSRVSLEDGIQVVFHLAPDAGGFHVGDYWTFTARTLDRSIEKLDRAIPRGIHHHFGRLAIVEAPNKVTDCRQLWPAPHLALRYLGGDGQQSSPGTDLPCPLTVGVEDQRARPKAGILVRFSDLGAGDILTDVNDPTNSGPSIVVKSDGDGRAQVQRRLGKGLGCHDVEVKLEAVPPQGSALRLLMEARAIEEVHKAKPLRLTRVTIAGQPFFNDRIVILKEFLAGVVFEFSEPMSPLAFANQIPTSDSE